MCVYIDKTLFVLDAFSPTLLCALDAHVRSCDYDPDTG